jgi:hypothetical protein
VGVPQRGQLLSPGRLSAGERWKRGRTDGQHWLVNLVLV